MTPQQAITQVTKQYADDGVTPYYINDGCCQEWAEDVMALLEGAPNKVELWETPFGFADTTHSFLRIDGKFIDAECPQGAADHMELPIFAKLAALGRPRQPVWLVDYQNYPENTHPTESRRDMTAEMVKEYDEMNGTSNAALPDNQ
jgi:hypothetical protein